MTRANEASKLNVQASNYARIARFIRASRVWCERTVINPPGFPSVFGSMMTNSGRSLLILRPFRRHESSHILQVQGEARAADLRVVLGALHGAVQTLVTGRRITNEVTHVVGIRDGRLKRGKGDRNRYGQKIISRYFSDN